MRRLLRFSALNVALGYVAVSLVVLAMFAAPLWYFWRHTIEQGRTEVLEADARNLISVFERRGPDVAAEVIHAQAGEHLENVEHILVLLADPSRVKRAGNLPVWPPELEDAVPMQTATIHVEGRAIRAVLLQRTLPGGYRLLIGRDVSRFERLETLFLHSLAGAAGVVVLLGLGWGLMVRRTLLSKVHDINQTASAIMQGNLAHRLPAHAGADELNRLVQMENRMLDQIEHLVNGVKHVSNAIAHDLRTPLAELRSRLEEVLVLRPGPEQTFAQIESAIADVDRLIGIFNALLRLAEIDTGTRRAGFVNVDADTVAREAAEFYQPVAELRGVTLTFTSPGPLALRGDPLLLAQAVGNLIDNALKYAHEDGEITVEASRCDDGTVEIAVSDNGPGIPEDEKPKALERFYRGDASRGTPGVGLGLSLVSAVAGLHDGALTLTDNHPGLRATLVLRSIAISLPHNRSAEDAHD